MQTKVSDLIIDIAKTEGYSGVSALEIASDCIKRALLGETFFTIGRTSFKIVKRG